MAHSQVYLKKQIIYKIEQVSTLRPKVGGSWEILPDIQKDLNRKFQKLQFFSDPDIRDPKILLRPESYRYTFFLNTYSYSYRAAAFTSLT